MLAMRIRATGTGRKIAWACLKKADLRDQPRSILALTTVLPDAIVDIDDYCRSLGGAYSQEVLVPNGFTSASFDIALIGESFKVVCGRRLARGWFPLNPLAAEFGKNYDVILAAAFADGEAEANLEKLLTGRYECKIV